MKKSKTVSVGVVGEYSDWLTFGEVGEILKCTARTVERKLKARAWKIQTKPRHQPGKRGKAVTVCHPGDVEQVRQSMEAPTFEVPQDSPNTAALVRIGFDKSRQITPPAFSDVADVARIVEWAVHQAQLLGNGGKTEQCYVNLDQAVQISGLPKSYILDTLHKTPEKLGALKFGSHTGWRINRRMLEGL